MNRLSQTEPITNFSLGMHFNSSPFMPQTNIAELHTYHTYHESLTRIQMTFARLWLCHDIDGILILCTSFVCYQDILS